MTKTRHCSDKGVDKRLSAKKIKPQKKSRRESKGIRTIQRVHVQFEVGLQWVGHRKFCATVMPVIGCVENPTKNGLGSIAGQSPTFQFRQKLQVQHLHWCQKGISSNLSEKQSASHFLHTGEEANLLKKRSGNLAGGEKVCVLAECGKNAAMVCSNNKKAKHGCNVFKWRGMTLTDQETGQLVCEEICWNHIPRASDWHAARSVPNHFDSHFLRHEALAGLGLHPISDEN